MTWFVVLCLVASCLAQGASRMVPERENESLRESGCAGAIRKKPMLRSASALLPPPKTWPNGRIPYRFHASCNEATKDLAQRAARMIMQFLPELEFVEVDSGANVVEIRGDTVGCWAHVGVQPGPQQLSLPTPQCDIVDAVHEWLHVAGLDHEQIRQDRDDFVEFGDIVAASDKDRQNCLHNVVNKAKYRTNNENSFFDTTSIMMYPTTISWCDKYHRTFIKAKSGLPEIKEQTGNGWFALGRWDVVKMANLYDVEKYHATTKVAPRDHNYKALNEHFIACDEGVMQAFALSTSKTGMFMTATCNRRVEVGPYLSRHNDPTPMRYNNVINLAYQDVDCEAGQALRSIHIVPVGEDEIRYSYHCSRISTLECQKFSTDYTVVYGGYDFTFLDRQEPECPDTYPAMQQFRLKHRVRKYKSGRTSRIIAYDFTCCSTAKDETPDVVISI